MEAVCKKALMLFTKHSILQKKFVKNLHFILTTF